MNSAFLSCCEPLKQRPLSAWCDSALQLGLSQAVGLQLGHTGSSAALLDFVFLSHLPGTAVPAHRAILVARCEVMAAMFNGNYMEAKSVLIPVYGVSKETFLSFLEYLYTDSCCPGTQYVCYKVISRDSSFSLFLVVCCL